MPIYALDDQEPKLPEPGRFWVAPDAHVIGRARWLEPTALSEFETVSIWRLALIQGRPRVSSIETLTRTWEREAERPARFPSCSSAGSPSVIPTIYTPAKITSAKPC